MLLSEAWDEYRSDKRIEGYSKLTLRNYQFQHGVLLRYIGDFDLNDIRTEALKEYIVDQAEHLKPSSLGHKIRFLKSFFNWACDEGYILKNPVMKLKEPEVGKRIPKFLSEWR